jgi:hypothetical protein
MGNYQGVLEFLLGSIKTLPRLRKIRSQLVFD